MLIISLLFSEIKLNFCGPRLGRRTGTLCHSDSSRRRQRELSISSCIWFQPPGSFGKLYTSLLHSLESHPRPSGVPPRRSEHQLQRAPPAPQAWRLLPELQVYLDVVLISSISMQQFPLLNSSVWHIQHGFCFASQTLTNTNADSKAS